MRDYPFQWFWDSCFHAIAWSRFDAARAADELRGLFAFQQEDGLLPHVVFWKGDLVSRLHWHHLESRTNGRIPFHRAPRTTAQMQPPVVAQAVERVVDAGAGDAFLAEALPHLERYYRYLAALRDPDGDDLISVISQFESGLDFSPVYDEAVGVGDPSPGRLLARTRLPSAAEQAGELRPRRDLPPAIATTSRTSSSTRSTARDCARSHGSPDEPAETRRPAGPSGRPTGSPRRSSTAAGARGSGSSPTSRARTSAAPACGRSTA